MRPAILLFARSPEPGKVKTRLAKAIGNERAAALYLAMVKDAAAAARGTGAEVIWWVEGGVRGLEGIIESDSVRRQPEGDLGERLIAGFEDAFGRGFGPVAAMGTDCPSLSAPRLQELLQKSAEFDAAFVPSPDGGYSAVGLGSPLPRAFEEIPWSTSSTLEVTLGKISSEGKRYRLLDEAEDIDEIESLLRFYTFVSEKNRPDASETARAMMAPEFDFLRSEYRRMMGRRGGF